MQNVSNASFWKIFKTILTLKTYLACVQMSPSLSKKKFYWGEGASVHRLKHAYVGPLYVYRNLPTYPSPKPTYCRKWEASVINVGLGERKVVRFPPSFACFSANLGYKGMFSFDSSKTKLVTRRVVFLLFLLCFNAVVWHFFFPKHEKLIFPQNRWADATLSAQGFSVAMPFSKQQQ